VATSYDRAGTLISGKFLCENYNCGLEAIYTTAAVAFNYRSFFAFHFCAQSGTVCRLHLQSAVTKQTVTVSLYVAATRQVFVDMVRPSDRCASSDRARSTVKLWCALNGVRRRRFPGVKVVHRPTPRLSVTADMPPDQSVDGSLATRNQFAVWSTGNPASDLITWPSSDLIFDN